MGRYNAFACNKCFEKHNFLPRTPCFQHVREQKLVLHQIGLMTDSIVPNCPLVASWEEVKDWVKELNRSKQTPLPRVESMADRALRDIKANLDKGEKYSEKFGFIQFKPSPDGNNVHLYQQPKVTSSRQMVFLRPLKPGEMDTLRNELERQGLTKPLSPAKRKEMENAASQSRPGSLPTPRQLPPPPADARFHRWNDDYVEKTLNALEASKTGSLGELYRAVYFDGVPLNYEDLKRGCQNLEATFSLALNKYLPVTLRARLPKDWTDGVEQTLALAQGLVIHFGMMAGAVAIGAVMGGVAGSAAGLPAAGARWGAAAAMFLFNVWATTEDAKAAVREVGDHSQALGDGMVRGWKANSDAQRDPAAQVIAKVLAIILAAIALRLLFKGAAKVMARRRKYAEAKKYFAGRQHWAGRYFSYLEDAQKELSEAEGHRRRGRLAEAEACENRAGRLQLEASRLDAFARETKGHVKVVVAGGNVLNKHLKQLRGAVPDKDDIRRRLQQKPYELDLKEAEAVAAHLAELEYVDFGGHDGGGLASKYMANIADGMKYPEPPLRKLSPERRKALYEQDPESWARAEKVQIAIDQHNEGFFHHRPRHPLHFAEWSIDLISALRQDRCYRDSIPWERIEGKYSQYIDSGGDPKLQTGWLKLARAVVRDLEGQKGQVQALDRNSQPVQRTWVQNPQHDIDPLARWEN